MITIAKVEMWALRIPLNVRFKHASAERAVTESVWVEVTDSEGLTGYGEGCPRPYVTGETVASCLEACDRWRPDLIRSIRTHDDLSTWVTSRRQEIDCAPAAWCALELAILDLLARRRGVSIETILGVPPLLGPFRYTAVLGDQDQRQFATQLQKYRALGFTDFKVKLGRDTRSNQAGISELVSAGIQRDHLRTDANNLWHSSDQAIEELRSIAPHFWAIEEPLASGDYAGMLRLSDSLGVVIILDESFTRAAQFSEVDAAYARCVVNLRISKMGGLLRSLEIARLAAQRGVPLIIGAQVGETSLLTRAALTVSQFAKAHLRGQEGAFGKHLLQTDVVEKSITFGAAGELQLDDSFSDPLAIVRPSAFLSPQ